MLQYNAKTALLAASVLATIFTIVIGQVAPALAQTTQVPQNLEKRSYAYLDDQHLTARFGNNKVCGDHLCGPGEWAKLQENISQAQISHPSNATGHAKTSMPSSSVSVNSASSQPKNVTSSAPVTAMPENSSQPKNMTSAMPVPVPPTVPSHVCTAVKTALGNSTAPNIVAKVLADLGCS